MPVPVEKDIKIARWLISKRYLNKEQAEQSLKLQERAAGEGKGISLLQAVHRLKILDLETLTRIQQELKAAATAQPVEGVSGKPSVPADPSAAKTPPPAAPTSGKTPAMATASATDAKKDDLTRRRGGRVAAEGPQGEEKVTAVAAEEADNDAPPQAKAGGARIPCPECDMDIPEEAKECPVCAAAIPLAVRARCVRCDHEVGSKDKECGFCGSNPRTGHAGANTQRCSSCSKVVLPDDALCPSCGAAGPSRSPRGVWAKLAAGLLLSTSCAAYGIGVHRMLPPAPSVTRSDVRVSAGSSFFADVPAEKLTAAPSSGSDLQKLAAQVQPLAKGEQWDQVIKILDAAKPKLDAQLAGLLALSCYRSGDFPRVAGIQKALPGDPFLQKLLVESSLKEARRLIADGECEKAFRGLESLQQGLERYEASFVASQLDIKELLPLARVDKSLRFWAGVAAYGAGRKEAQEHLAAAAESGVSEAHLFLAALKFNSEPESVGAHLDAFRRQKPGTAYGEVLKKLQPGP